MDPGLITVDAVFSLCILQHLPSLVPKQIQFCQQSNYDISEAEKKILSDWTQSLTSICFGLFIEELSSVIINSSGQTGIKVSVAFISVYFMSFPEQDIVLILQYGFFV